MSCVSDRLKNAAQLLALSLMLFATTPVNGQEANAEEYAPGLIVTAVEKTTAADTAGVRPGDLLVTLDGQSLRFESQIAPIKDKALWDLKRTIVLEFVRDSHTSSVSLALSLNGLGFSVRPPLPPAALKLYNEAIAVPQDQTDLAMATLKAAADSAMSDGDNRAAAWLMVRAYFRAFPGNRDEAAILRATLPYVERSGDLMSVANLLNILGNVALDHHQLEAADAYFKRALPIVKQLAPDSLALAGSFANMGWVAAEHGKSDEVEAFYQPAAAIYQRVLPGSLDLARSLNNLGLVAQNRSELDKAESYYKPALAILERLSPRSPNLPAGIGNLADIAMERGKLDEAEAGYQKVLAILLARPDIVNNAEILNGLGSVADARYKLDEAETYYRRALDVAQQRATKPLVVAASLANLGNIASNRGKLEEAEAFYRRALAIQQERAPDSQPVAETLINLGACAADRGKLEDAKDYCQRAQVILTRLAPDSLTVAINLTNLGVLAHDRGRLDEAVGFHKRALAIRDRIAPDSIATAVSLGNLGSIAHERGDLHGAMNYLNRALAILENRVPNSLDRAGILYDIGSVEQDRGKWVEAERDLQQAWSIVRQQASQVAGDNGRQEFGKATATYAAGLVAIQVKRGEPDRALVTSEEARAQALSQSMAERSITSAVTPPPIWGAYQTKLTAYTVAFKDCERSAARLDSERAAIRSLHAEKANDLVLSAEQHKVDAAASVFETNRQSAASARDEMEFAWKSVLKAASIALPAPLDPIAARRRLPQGVLLLEFTAGAKQIVLFAITKNVVHSYVLPTSRKEIEGKLAIVRRGIAGDSQDRSAENVNVPASDSDYVSQQALRQALRTLFRQLFPTQVQLAIQVAKRIVISPNDLLWDLPFAALITSKDGPAAYLGLQKPISYTQSLTLFFTRPPSQNAPGSGALVVGNPVYDYKRRAELVAAAVSGTPTAHSGTKIGDRPATQLVALRRRGELGVMTRDGDAPRPLPFANEEARQVARQYHTIAHTGTEPTEAWFRQHAGQASIIHLATHGFLNSFSAQSSGVLLAVPEKQPPDGQYDDDGALQAWEIWNLKLRADLVVLSACETGRGAKVIGEGLIGLTRSLQYAGAKTIVASQWKVSDESTAVLMTSFHKHLLHGAARDEALRLAMNEVAHNRSRGWSAPYFWAAFVLVGETGKMPH